MNIRAARLATKGLIGTCGVLLLLLIVQYAGFGRGYGWTPDSAADVVHAPLGTIDSTPLQLPPESAFADIDAQPLFNEDRKPTPFDATDSTDAAPASPLNVALTGVIVDDRNHVRIAMLQDKTRNQAIALKVGMPLDGDQANWTLVEVKPRSVVFRSAANETTEVELETAAAPPAPATGRRPPLRPVPGQPPLPVPNADSEANKSGAGGDLARRIEERRKQMREEAERLRAGQPAQPKKK